MLHHRSAEASAISKDHVCISPRDLKHVTLFYVELGGLILWPSKDILVLGRVNFLKIGIVYALQINWDVKETFEKLHAPTSLKLVHHRAREDAFASAVTQIDKSATWDIKGIVPAVRVSVFPFSLDPFEDLEERFKLDLSISQIDLFEAFLVPLAPTFRLYVSQNQNSKG